MQYRVPVLSVSWLLFAAAPAIGVDGVLEINQTCAVSSGCSSGDPAGFPVFIDTAGVSVRLTSALTVPDANTTAIVVNAPDVTIDLNGFTIKGTTVCSGTPTTSCTPTGGGSGIAGGAGGTTVSNGRIRGMGFRGLELGTNSRVVGVEVVSNGSEGIMIGPQSVVTGCVVSGNGALGIAGDILVIRENVIHGNGSHGMDSAQSLLLGNAINGNALFGLQGPSAYGHNQLNGNNGGNANPQASGGNSQIAPNQCGGDLTCP